MKGPHGAPCSGELKRKVLDRVRQPDDNHDAPRTRTLMTPDDLRAWQAQMGYTYNSAAQALGMSRSGYAKMLAGHTQIERRTALACAAIAQGVKPWPCTPVAQTAHHGPRLASSRARNHWASR